MQRSVAAGLGLAAILVCAGTDIALSVPRPGSRSRTVPDFSGFWRTPEGGRGFDQREACAAIKDPSGAPMLRCSQPWEAKGGAQVRAEGLPEQARPGVDGIPR